MKKIILAVLLAFVACASVYAHAWGTVLDDKGYPLVGANVYWAGTTIGVATDLDGRFKLEPTEETNLLVTSFMGFHNDTTEVTAHSELTIVLVSDLVLEEVNIVERKMAVLRSRVSALQVETLTGEALCMAACCNLSESFETSASVDVAYSDAATGAKQIRLLGLSGTYVQMLTENTPNIRGLAQSFGMEYIPGPWMEAIQVSKGTSSVLNGYEAIAGQINVEYLKPQTQDPIALNAMISTETHAEVNASGGWDLNDKVSTGILFHAQNMSLELDHNHDGFLDMPKNTNVNLLNRWYVKTGDYTGQFLVRGLYDRRQGGLTKEATESLSPYKIDLNTWRVDGFMKNGYVFDAETGTSIGIIASASYHNQQNTYGSRQWNAAQTNAYINAIFQTSFDDLDTDPGDDHTYKLSAGLSVNYDGYDESLLGERLEVRGKRYEVTPGVFAEYTYTYKDKVTLLMGIREDYSTRYGFFTTPRMNLRYAPFEWWTLRGSIGLGYRTPNAIADNAAYLASNREYYLGDGQLAIGDGQWQNVLAQEQSLNTGLSTVFYIPLGKKELQLSGEYYYTVFADGVIADMDRSLYGVTLYNMHDVEDAEYFSHNWQVEASMEILRGWTMTAAFRYTDVKQTSFNSKVGEYQLRDKPLQNKFKGIITTSYQTPLKTWQFDLTAQFNGEGRMPDGFVIPKGSKQYHTLANGQVYHKWYPQLLGQITKFFRTWSIYLGAENMTNFTQDSPIVGERVSGDKAIRQEARGGGFVNPHSANYDASMIWAPIHGWKLYLGFRWALEREE
ncbi:MAG: TonB-dependent receptor [Paludibacteraceae bacterium]|nr:TonB-dependent receptor [Paludibacteraceae bacterium]